MATPTPTSTPPPATPPPPTGLSPTEEKVLDTLLDIVRYGGSRDAAEAQAIMLRRLALQGDVVSSRIPAPRNITEVGGYVNLLQTLQQPDLEGQMLAAALGVAGPNPPPGWAVSAPPLAITSLANDRPAGPAQASTPLSFSVRSDFVAPLQAAIAQLHDFGAALPLWTMPTPLPATATDGATVDLLALLGRSINIMPTATFDDPITDPVVLARAATSAPGTYQLYGHVTNGAPRAAQVPLADWQALYLDAATGSFKEHVLNNFRLLPLAPLLAPAGFYPIDPLHQPTSATDTAWARLDNVTGLLPGVTTLGSELALLFSPGDIAASGLVGRQAERWNGTTFAP